MPYALHVDKLDPAGVIHVRHTFYAETEEECRRLMETHASGCPEFGPAVEKGKTIEEIEEIAELPEWEAD